MSFRSTGILRDVVSLFSVSPVPIYRDLKVAHSCYLHAQLELEAFWDNA